MFYQKYCAKIISDMTQVVVAIGLITVLSNYVRSGLMDAGLWAEPDFWQRWALLVVTILFASYHLIAYTADLACEPADTAWAAGDRSPSKIIVLFLVDLAGLGALGAMFAVLAVGGAAGIERFAVEWPALSWLAGFAATWHGLNVVWHVLAGSRWSAWGSHFGFGALFAGLAAWAHLSAHDRLALPAAQVEDLWILAFAGVVLMLYFTRGRRLIRTALSQH
ncbi:hypothetical protein DDZ18_09565 [Marinicauda salina]|uniref:Uncharacterized protein n=1 Tax=Marinicauda salina TaxID=2135793 RepID=A0A2U2BSH6_9PROT|nr:hypothetical protein [Marinicauda salina]PWE16948.1 hypothetical protein DDZ18_09565 [Marinicauda salina]